MTRWLKAARQSASASTEMTKPTERAGGPVLSVKSVSSGVDGSSRCAPAGGGLSVDASTYMNCLRHHGPLTYGAAAMKLGWGASRSWQAQNDLRKSAAITFDEFGRAVPTEVRKTNTGQD